MEENKVTISLEDYLIMHDTIRDLQRIIDDIVDYSLSNSEIDLSYKRIIMSYDARNKFLEDVIRKHYPSKYEGQYEKFLLRQNQKEEE